MSEILDIAAALSRLLKAENVLLICHKNPDGDTIGSAAALYWALKGLGKTVAVLCADPIPSRYDYMDIGLYTGQFTPGYTVAVDVAGIQLFGDSIAEYTRRIDMCIDHHPSNSGYADCMLLDGDAAATAEIIYELLTAIGTEITPTIADCLYTGLSTDTSCFKFANTTARTHEIAAKLITAGASLVKLNNILFESKSRSRLAIERLALESLEYSFGGRCATVYLTKEQIAETGADGTDLEGITSLPRMIEGVEVGITIRQQPTGSYKVSVRTVTGVDASAICAHLGGGGHKQAAGCELLGSLDNAKAAYDKLVARVAALSGEGTVDEGAVERFKNDFLEAVGNDLNTSLGVTALYDVLKAGVNDATKRATLDSFDQVLGLELLSHADALKAQQAAPVEGAEEIEALIAKRLEAKRAKNWAEADAIRDQLRAMGVEIKDGKDGTTWTRI
mgnify:CR=1 FL=1